MSPLKVEGTPFPAGGPLTSVPQQAAGVGQQKHAVTQHPLIGKSASSGTEQTAEAKLHSEGSEQRCGVFILVATPAIILQLYLELPIVF